MYQGCIQHDDGRGGYNCEFRCPNSPLVRYHIHFARGGTRVRAIRYYSQPSVEGNNLYVDDSNNPRNLREIINGDLSSERWHNHHELLNHFRSAIQVAFPDFSGGELPR